MTGKRKSKLLRLVIDFIKLQLSGNILFWGTYLGYFLLHEVAHWHEVLALAIASISAHTLFFLVDKKWVFNDKTGRRKTSVEITRFVIFMGLNYFINIGIVTGLSHYFHITPYIGQFVAAAFFTVWNFIGLRFWVFQDMQHHALTAEDVEGGRKPRARTSKRRRKSSL